MKTLLIVLASLFILASCTKTNEVASQPALHHVIDTAAGKLPTPVKASDSVFHPVQPAKFH